MTTVTTLDASVLIALMNPHDAHHGDAVGVVRRAAITGELVAHPMTIAESAVGAADYGKLQEMRRAFVRLGLAAAPSDGEEPWRLAELRASTRLPLPDCCVLDVALETHGTLATFDTRLAAVARARGVTLAFA